MPDDFHGKRLGVDTDIGRTGRMVPASTCKRSHVLREGTRPAGWFTSDSASVMDQNVSRDIKHAWSEGKNATAAMAFQEHGEIAIGEGKEKEAKQYFEAAENELGTLEPEHASY